MERLKELVMDRRLVVSSLAFAVWFSTLLPVSLGRAEQGNVRFVLKPSKTTYCPFEPVVLEYAIVNSGSSDIDVPPGIAPRWGRVKFEIAVEDGDFVKYSTGVHADGVALSLATLKPGETLAAEVQLLTNANAHTARNSLLPEFQGVELFPFAKPGTYRVRAAYPLEQRGELADRKMLMSEVAEFSVRDFGVEDREAFEFFSTPEGLAAAVGGDVPIMNLGSAMEEWEEFVRRFPNSVYAPAVRVNLGGLYLAGTGVPPRSDPGRAADHYAAVVVAGAEGYVDTALVQLAKCRIESGKFDEAASALSVFFDRFPESAQVKEAARLREGLNKGCRSLTEIYSN